MKTKYPKLFFAAPIGLAIFASSNLHAQIAWDGGGGNTDYSNNLNWAGDIIPGDGNNDGALIGSSSTQTVIYNTATSYTSTGTAKANSLLVGTGTAGVGSLTLSGSAGTLTFGGDPYNNAAWIGSGSNTDATGTVTVSAGKLAIGTGAGSDASINLGVQIGGSGVKSGTLVINGGTVEVGRRILMSANSGSATGVLTLSSGTLDMKRTGSNGEADLGMIRFGGGNNTVNLDGGTAILTGFHTTGAAIARSNIYFNGTTLRANIANSEFIIGNSTTHTNLQIKNGGLIMDTNTFAVTINDVLSNFTGNDGILRKEGTGTLTLTAANTYTGTTTVSGGVLEFSGSGKISTASAITVQNGGTLQFSRFDTWGNDGTSATSAITIDTGGIVQSNNSFNTLIGLTLNGGTLSANDGVNANYPTFFLKGTVTVNATAGGSSISTTGVGDFNTLAIGAGSGGGPTTFAVADGAAASDLTVSAPLSNIAGVTASGLSKTGDGTMTLSAANTYTGTTTVTAGILSLTNNLAIQNSALVTTGAGNVQLTGTTPTFGGLSGATGSLATVISSGYGSVTALTLNPLSGSVNYGGVISNGAANMTLTKTGAGTQILTGSNIYSGSTTVNGGTLSVQGGGTLGSGATTVSGSGSILDLNKNDTWGGHTGSSQALTIQSGGLVTNGGSLSSGYNTLQTLALDGGELRVTGTANSGLGFQAYGIRDTVTVTGTTASSITNPTSIANAGINIGGFTDTGAGVGSSLTFNVADVTSSSATDLTVSAVLKNNTTSAFAVLANGLVKTGVGTMTLSAANTYTGATEVVQGTLSLGQPYLADAADVKISATTTLDLNFAATDVVEKLFIGGVQQVTGLWGAVGNMAASHTSPRITGSGLLSVTTGPTAGYAGWASGFLPAFTNTTPSIDFENDGLASGIEWVVGGNPTLNDAASVAPTFNNTTSPTDFLFTFRRRDTASADPNTTIVVEYGSTLAGWTQAQNGVSGVSINDTTDLGGGFRQVTVAIPRILAMGNKLFARLRVTVVTP